MDQRKILENAIERAQKAGAGGVKTRYSQASGNECLFEKGRLKSCENSKERFYGIEVLIDGKVGRTMCNDPADFPAMTDRAVELARRGSAAHFAAYPSPREYNRVETCSPGVGSVPLDDFVGFCRQIVDALKKYDPDLFINAEAGKNENSKILITTGGVDYETRGSMWHLYGGIQRTRGTDMLFADEVLKWRELNALYDPRIIIESILTDLENARETVRPPEGKCPVVLDSKLFAKFLGILALGVNGKQVHLGNSPLAGRIGETVLHPGLTVIDNPHRNFSPGARELDSNGIPTRRITLIDKGRLTGFLYDLDTAGLTGNEPTGNDDSSPYAFEVGPGEKESSELVAGIPDGLFVKDLMGFGQGNIINGDFSANVALGYRIVNGKITGRVKNTMIGGNFYEIFKKSLVLSSDLHPILNVPFAAAEGFTVNTVKTPGG